MRKRERIYQFTFALFLLSIYGMVYWLQKDIPFYFCLFSAFVCSVLSFRFRQIRCPHCGKTIHQYWQHFQYCPYCRCALDQGQTED